MARIQIPTVIEAFQKAAQKFGIRELAEALDKAPSTVYSELNPWADRHSSKLGLEDAATIAQLTDDVTGFVLLLDSLGYALVPKNAVPYKATVAEELADDMIDGGEFARVCMDPEATDRAVTLAADALVQNIRETEAIKKTEISTRRRH